MNKQKIVSSIIFIFSIFLMTSCTDEPVDPVLAAQIAANNSATNNVSNSGGSGTSSGDYMPLALNNVWNYQLYNSSTIKDYKVNAIESIDGKTYYRLNHAITSSISNPFITDSDVTVHLRKLNGDYYQRTYIHSVATATTPGITIEPFELIFLKDYLNVGASFTQNINMNVTTTTNGISTTTVQPVTYIITMLAKDLTLTVGSTTYTNVIKIKIDDDGGYSYDWFSKDIGWIKSEDYDSTGAQTDGLSLTTFSLF